MESNLLKMDGYDDCIVGICHKHGQEPFIVYSYDKVINNLMQQGMDYDEAVEFHEFNQASAWMGPTTPAFLYKYEI